MPYVEKMNQKDKEEGDVPGGSNGGDKKKKNEKMKMKKMHDMKEDAGDDDVEDSAKHVVDGGDVGGGEGGDNYVIGGDGVAVIHGVRMVPFHMNMPALRGWEKGGSDKGKKVSRKSHPGEAVVKKEVKNPVLVLLEKVLAPEKYLVPRKRLWYLLARKRFWLEQRTRLLCPWEVFHFREVCNFWMIHDL